MQEYKISTKRKVIRWVTVIAFFYGLTGIALFYLQEKFLFHPQPLPRDYVFKFSTSFKELNIAINERDTLNMIQFFPERFGSKRSGVVFSWQYRQMSSDMKNM